MLLKKALLAANCIELVSGFAIVESAGPFEIIVSKKIEERILSRRKSLHSQLSPRLCVFLFTRGLSIR